MEKLAQLMSFLLAVLCLNAVAASQPGEPGSVSDKESGYEVDNTGVNNRDKNGETLTPEKQANAPQDRNLLASVRQAIVEDESLSTMAHNVKLVVQNGVVVLRGPVANATEKEKIASLAKGVEGVAKVDNQLDIKTP